MNLSKFSVIFLSFLLLSNMGMAQWSLIPHTADKKFVTMEVSGKYMFLSAYRNDSGVVRMDLTNDSWMDMKSPSGSNFKANSTQKFYTSGKHIQYLNDNYLFVSHDYGISWAKRYSIGAPDLSVCVKDSLVFISYGPTMERSGDFGETYKWYFRENYYLGTLKPMLVHKNRLLFVGERGLFAAEHSKLGTATTIYNKPSPFYSMVNMGDTLIGSSYDSFFVSTNGGTNWKLVNGSYTGNYIYQLAVNNNMLYTCVSMWGLLVSFDKGINFYSLTHDLPFGVFAFRVAFDSQFIYVLTTKGVYKRPNNVDRSIGIRNEQPLKSFEVFPNPTHSIVNISIPEIKHLEVYNQIGQKVIVSTEIESNGAVLDFGLLPAGVYMVQISTADGQQTVKVLRE